jgi:DNA-binding transcriptional LysR family regulator
MLPDLDSLSLLVRAAEMKNLTHLAVVMRNDDPLAAQTPLAFADVLERDLVGLEGGSTLTRLLEAQAAVLLQPMALRVQVRSFEAVCRAVEARLGIGVLPQGAAGSVAGAMGLKVEPLTDAWALRAMRVCTRQKPQANLALGGLVAHLQGLAD